MQGVFIIDSMDEVVAEDTMFDDVLVCGIEVVFIVEGIADAAIKTGRIV